MKPLQRQRVRENTAETAMERSLDTLAQFETFTRDVLPALQKDIQEGMSADKLAQKYSSIAMARIITTLVLDADNSKATTAAKDVLDRAMGKPKEQKTLTHKMAEMSDEQLDSMIKSLQAETGSDE